MSQCAASSESIFIDDRRKRERKNCEITSSIACYENVVCRTRDNRRNNQIEKWRKINDWLTLFQFLSYALSLALRFDAAILMINSIPENNFRFAFSFLSASTACPVAPPFWCFFFVWTVANANYQATTTQWNRVEFNWIEVKAKEKERRKNSSVDKKRLQKRRVSVDDSDSTMVK